uniref:Uncharacterized protein n=1 Tax=Anguilla anguilla TaxID=7936 RepID=A0A0E9XFD0_ANGAN
MRHHTLKAHCFQFTHIFTEKYPDFFIYIF